MSFFDKMKKASKQVVDAGAKTMLKVRVNRWRCNVYVFVLTMNCADKNSSTLCMTCTGFPGITMFICSVFLTLPFTHFLFWEFPFYSQFSKQTDIVFLDREIKNRKQAFGIEIYDLMETLETNTTMSNEDKEAKIRAAFDSARKDIAVIVAKKECKQEEMSVLEVDNAGGSSDIPPASGTVITNSHPQGM